MFQKNTSSLQLLDLSSDHLKTALNYHLYVSLTPNGTLSVLCYDNVLCYLSNAVDHGSTAEIETNFKRYFTSEQIEQAFDHLRNSLHYSLTLFDSSDDDRLIELMEECRDNLIHSSCLLPVVEMLKRNKLFSYLPIFVTNDWIHMIRQMQELEKIDTPSSKIPLLEEQINYVKEQLSSLNDLVLTNSKTSSLTINESSVDGTDQCCLRTYCQHAFNQRFTSLIDSPSSSRSSLELERSPLTIFNRMIPGFIRNPVSSFLMPTRPTVNEMASANHLHEENFSSDDESTANSKTGSMVVIRDDEVWIYPAGVNVRRKKTESMKSFFRSQSMFNPVNNTKESLLKSTRRKSFEDDDYPRNHSEKFPAQLKKHKKGKGLSKREREETICHSWFIVVEETPWFPRRITDLDKCSVKVLLYGVDLDADHPVGNANRRRNFQEKIF